ncbi:MAG TPA: DUF434 domain-containing protein [Candidatus Hydrogenedentes bacterium]|nr:DUF434 domain-containing protein [Candidatus Hydrogenedentota bacterium]HPC18003.1 DUF434 domain-containing protein [Candidatus Hydrogenedentota bacterium]HRT21227.1 DUF434 domain-containing protein [Candidatus Hydrogenedentota bacterium]HRT66477.1 DUF434 domain-containing protein [Candidatus Hydrogenedentota bacterium]
MPHRQQHRGKHPEDNKLFADDCLPVLREAVADLSLFLSKGYPPDPSLALVGDHFQLDIRQRRAVGRAACSDEAIERRKAHRVPVETLKGSRVIIDGYNFLIMIESLLGGGILIRGRDGCVRDLASIHGSYRYVEETVPAIDLAGRVLRLFGVGHAEWLLDAPVSNSGRLKSLLLDQAAERGWAWDARLSRNVDAVLAQSREIVVTSDGWILDRAQRWVNLADHLVERLKQPVRILNLA